MLLASCNEKDNALEQIVNQPNLEGIQKALYKNAEIKIEYSVAGSTTVYTASLKNTGTIDEPNYEVQGDFPELDYNLSYTLDYKKLDGERFLLFTVFAENPNDDAPAGTRTDSEDPDYDIEVPTKFPVLVVDFELDGNQQYEVYALPGFTFGAFLSINDTEIEIEKASGDNTAKVTLAYETVENMVKNTNPLTDLGQMEIGYSEATTWGEIEEFYDFIGMPIFGTVNTDNPGTDDDNEAGLMVIDLSAYEFIYNPDDDLDVPNWVFTLGYESDLGAFYESRSDDNVSGHANYLAVDILERLFIPCYDIYNSGSYKLIDVMVLRIPNATMDATDGVDWRDIILANPGMLEVVQRKNNHSDKKVNCVEGAVHNAQEGSTFGVFPRVMGSRVTPEDFDENYPYMIFPLSNWAVAAYEAE
jgi:hypothetical protein